MRETSVVGGIKSNKSWRAGRQEQVLAYSLKTLLQSSIKDPEWSGASEIGHALQISVWVRWVAIIGWLAVNNYRPDLDEPSYIPNNLLALAVLAFNAYIHYRLRKGQRVNWQSALALSVTDLVAISLGLLNSYGFFNGHYVLYYPALAFHFPSFGR